MKSEELDRLIAEVGPLDEAILSCVRTPEGVHALRFEDLDLLVENDEARDCLVLSSEIGAPAASRAAAVYETMLAYNLLWRETGGLRIALTSRGGSLVQLVDIASGQADARMIATVAVNLADRTRVWRAYLEAEGRDVAAPAPIASDAFIRA